MKTLRYLFCVSNFLVVSIVYSQTTVSDNYTVETFATGIAVPVTIAFIGPEEFLAVEKDTGVVKHRLRGEWLEDAGRVDALGSGELGLLGICVDVNYQVNHFVYLFYSVADPNSGNWLEDRVDKFLFVNNRLLRLTTLWKSTFDPNQNNSGSHHGGVIQIGPDGKLYICYGDLGRGRLGDPRVETNSGLDAASRSGCIYRINTDGSVPLDNPFALNPLLQLRDTWLYGVRNVFGLAFDPVNDTMWFTENGPDRYDELNIGFAGMNSGWLKIMGPDSRDAIYFENNFTAYDASDLSLIDGAQYADPEFSWLNTIAPTAIAFPFSDKFSIADRSLMLVADANYGEILGFPLNSSRNRIQYKQGTGDKVADNASERDLYLFGSEMGLLTDLKMGPEGYLYAVDLAGGRILRIRPKHETFDVQDYRIASGRYVSGDESSFSANDGNEFVTENSLGTGGTSYVVSLELSFHAPTNLFSRIGISAAVSAPDVNLHETIELYDYVFNSFVQIDSRTIFASETTFQLPAMGIARNYIDPETGTIRARVSVRPTGISLAPSWQFLIDQFQLSGDV